jgi:hypothetical protein
MSHCQGLSGDVGGLMVDLVRKYFDWKDGHYLMAHCRFAV